MREEIRKEIQEIKKWENRYGWRFLCKSTHIFGNYLKITSISRFHCDSNIEEIYINKKIV
jgi:hypothetical protein